MSDERETEPLGARRENPRPAELAPGDHVGPWRIDGAIAAGGCGAVYRATHRVIERTAAVKVLHAELAQSPPLVARFVFEARAVNRIRHPNIVDIFDFGELADGRPYLAMELLDADNLEDRVRAAGRFTLAEAIHVAGAIGDALAAAHAVHVVHRDVKARNIGFAGDRVKLLDFGIAKLVEPGAGAAPTQRLGTPQTMSPEQIRGEPVGPWTDIYALGGLVYFLLAGRHPFEAAEPEEVERLHLSAPVPPLADRIAVPPAIDALVAGAMAKEPAARPAAIADVVARLRACTRF